MIALFGKITLVLALVLSLLQSVLPLGGFWRHNPYLLAFARPLAWGQLMFVVIAYTLLTSAFVSNDFSIAYVAANSHPSLPLMYRLTAVWGAHEGSILLWILVLNIWTVIFSMTHKNNTGLPLVLAILGLISFCFLNFLLLTSDPFITTLLPQTGHDLNPLLQDPGFVIHPPMLYTGYVGFAVAFAITQAALIRGNLDTAWARTTRSWTIAAWCFLTLGITLGSWWAYRVLGWGGFWFWDPVENASLLPWLSGTALIHVLIVVEKRAIGKAWAALLAMITFSLSLLGTFLVRSGVLISAHTFANDPARGIFLLLLFAILLTAALTIYVIRIPQMSSPPVSTSWLSREMGLLVNSALFFVVMATVLLGTLYPLILDALGLGTISVGAPYFNLSITPLILLLMIIMGLVPFTQWQAQLAKNLFKLSWKKIIASILSALFLSWTLTGHFETMVVISLSLSLFVILSVFDYLRYHPGMSFAHIGFAILIIGIVLSNALSEEREVRIRPGTVTHIGPYEFYFLNTEGVNGSNYRGIRANFEVVKNNRHITNLYPEKRIYTVREIVMTKVAIHPSIFRDLYVALGEPLDQTDEWIVRFYYKPFIRFIWFGGGFMILGGLFALLQHRKIWNSV